MKGRVPALTQEALERRGAVVTIDPEESIAPLDTPVFPPELHIHNITIRDMIQRGGFSDSVFGVGDSELSSLRIATTISSTQQLLDPYEEALKGLFGDIVNDLLRDDLRYGYVDEPNNLPEDFSYHLDYEIDIPGDFVNRANIARILNPNFQVSSATIIESLFKSEIRSPQQEFARIKGEESLNDERITQALFRVTLTRLINRARLAGDTQLAQALEAQLEQEPSQELGGVGELLNGTPGRQGRGTPIAPPNPGRTS